MIHLSLLWFERKMSERLDKEDCTIRAARRTIAAVIKVGVTMPTMSHGTVGFAGGYWGDDSGDDAVVVGTFFCFFFFFFFFFEIVR